VKRSDQLGLSAPFREEPLDELTSFIAGVLIRLGRGV
jgi:hypothetical protein